MIVAASFVLLAAAGCFSFRLVRGPSLADRVIALDGLLLVGLAAVTARAVRTGDGAFLPVVVVLTLVGFIGTAMVSRFIEESER
ncbi:MAG: monovalent cation/H+ antiporter complex subunit F [Acidimicrobiales bacterium]